MLDFIVVGSSVSGLSDEMNPLRIIQDLMYYGHVLVLNPWQQKIVTAKCCFFWFFLTEIKDLF